MFLGYSGSGLNYVWTSGWFSRNINVETRLPRAVPHQIKWVFFIEFEEKNIFVLVQFLFEFCCLLGGGMTQFSSPMNLLVEIRLHTEFGCVGAEKK